jgi:membrane protein DedA with SNARE-associated domain
MWRRYRVTTLHYTNSIILACLVIAIGLAIFASLQLQSNETIVAAVASLGYIGVFIAGLIAGLNFIFPVPAATLSPLFTEADLTIPFIIIFLAAGTLVADFIGYLIGRTSHSIIKNKHPKIVALANRVSGAHPGLLVVFVTIYAALVPLPNELILIPLAFAGVSWRLLLVPLFVGAVIIQTLLVTGMTWVEVLL